MNMIRFDIYADDKYDVGFRCRDGHFGDELYENIYDYLTRRFNLEHEQAEDAASWCELATVGEEYEGDGFEIVVEEC